MLFVWVVALFAVTAAVSLARRPAVAANPRLAAAVVLALPSLSVLGSAKVAGVTLPDLAGDALALALVIGFALIGADLAI
jgi:hypothetical protein